MKFKILGSGGCVALPKPTCTCKVCKQARKKGIPYSRFGCSLYVEDLHLLIDTPEDIAHALNYFDIQEVNTVLYSHMDPDHTLGMRVFEQLRLNWFEVFDGKECANPITVFAMKHVMDDLNCIHSKYGSYLDYYENVRGLINRKTVQNSVCLGNITITFVRVGSATIFVFEEEGKKLIYAPCDVKPFPSQEIFDNADVMIIGNTIVGNVLKNGFIVEKDNPINDELFNMDDIINLKNTYNIQKVIMTHLEEDWGKSYDDYLELEKQYDSIYFAYDGMVIEV